MNNEFIVFYAWQNLNPAQNKNLIESCLDSALRELALPGPIARLDRDTKGIAGTPDIVDTILAKIRAASVFVGDVSLVGKDQRGELTPNPNVMFELGYAVALLGWERVVLITNEALGRWDDGPFDLGGTRRWPIRYSLLAQEDKPSSRIELRAKLREALRAIARLPTSAHTLQCGAGQLNVRDFLGMSRSGTNPIEVRTFQAKLINFGDRPIRKVDGFIQVDHHDKRFPLKLNHDGILSMLRGFNHFR